jgi:chitinase
LVRYNHEKLSRYSNTARYLQHFDIKAISQYIDWFNFMAYDLHGTWDADSKYVGAYIAPHTNITEIDLGLDLLWRAGVDSSKVVLGEGWVCISYYNFWS